MALAAAISHLDGRFGARTVVTATASTERAAERCFATGTSFDRLAGGIEAGAALALTGEGTCGKTSLALRAVAGAQREGGMALWVDHARSFDALAAQRAGVDLRRILVVRARSRDEVLLASAAGLRSEGFRLVVIDLGPAFAATVSPDDLAPILPRARGSTSALVVLADVPPRRLALPTFAFERVAWERRHGRTAGWTFEIRRSSRGDPRSSRGDPRSSRGDPRLGDVREERAVLCASALGRELTDLGTRRAPREEAPDADAELLEVG